MNKSTFDIKEIKFDDRGLVPAIAQDSESGEVLMLAYMNEQALKKTIGSGRAHYYSRSRQELWLKGDTSGHFQDVQSLAYDCDADTILLKVDQKGVACHTGHMSCFFNKIDIGEAAVTDGGSDDANKAPQAEIIKELYQVLLERKDADPEESYVAALYNKGFQKIAAKIHEESAELIDAAKRLGNKEIVHELADLWFHTLVLLGYKDIQIEEVFKELGRRFGTSGHEEKKSRTKKEE